MGFYSQKDAFAPFFVDEKGSIFRYFQVPAGSFPFSLSRIPIFSIYFFKIVFFLMNYNMTVVTNHP
ncbi:MAG TPA: hypothetical protein DD618_03405 [Acholeplasmatales bacterium]|nr:hypothetical protein [Acholeplasmatales bacterium]